jgi:hypothetical protein
MELFPPGDNLPITDNQRRWLSSGMLIIETALVRMGEELQEAKLPRVMSVSDDSITTSERKQMLSLLNDLRGELNQFVRRYELEPVYRDVRRSLAAHASQIWVTLEDSHPSLMRGYGKMPESDAIEVEQHLSRMLRIVKDLQEVTRSKPDRTSSGY